MSVQARDAAVWTPVLVVEMVYGDRILGIWKADLKEFANMLAMREREESRSFTSIPWKNGGVSETGKISGGTD